MILEKETSTSGLGSFSLLFFCSSPAAIASFFLRPRHPTQTFNLNPFQKKKKKNSKQCIRDTDDPRKCKALRDDYLECLHHRKEIARLNTVYREQKKADAAAAANKGGAAAAAAEKKH